MRDGPTIIVPVKPWTLAKTRLGLAPSERTALARAFALDTLECVDLSASAGHCVIVTACGELARVAHQMGATLVTDRPLLSSRGLADAVQSGRLWAAARRPRSGVVVVPADLPSLTPSVLDEAVATLSLHDRAFVPDAAGQGTTLLWARTPSMLIHAYGVRSASVHEMLGHTRCDAVDRRARQDVDNPQDLQEARHLGLGRHTEQVVGGLVAQAGKGRGR